MAALGPLAPSWQQRLSVEAEERDAYEISGSISLKEPLKLYFEDEDGTRVQKISFPMQGDSSELQALLDACSPAAFGMGSETKIDPTVRKALQMPAARLALGISADLLGAALLEDIRAHMMPHAAAVRAEAYALNVYGPDGFFKTHRDTPRHQDMFGSLVMCLPTEFSGGELVIRSPNGASEVRHDWGASGLTEGAGAGRIAWSAFFSDCEHHITRVITGHRTTVTFNLYRQAVPSRPPPTVTVASAFGDVLAAALQDPGWYPQGVKLGFALEHLYVVEEAGTAMPSGITPGMLKGADRRLYRAACDLGLSARIVPVIEMRQDASPRDVPGHPADPDKTVLAVGDKWYQETDDSYKVYSPSEQEDEGDERWGHRCCRPERYRRDSVEGREWDVECMTEEEFMAGRHGVRMQRDDVVWVKPPGQQHLHYRDRASCLGNEFWATAWYAAAALMVEVPASSVGVRLSRAAQQEHSSPSFDREDYRDSE